MSRKHVVRYPAFVAASMSAQAVSTIISTAEMDKASLHLAWTGSPVGTFTVQVKNDPTDTFYTLNFGAPLAVAAGTNEMQLIFTEMPFAVMQIIYTPTSGSGSLNGALLQKSVGA